MADEQKSNDEIIDDLEKNPEELEKTLNNEVDDLDHKTQSPADDETADQKKEVSKGDDPADDPSKKENAGEGNDEDSDPNKDEKKESGIDRLLHTRNEARNEAASEKEKRIAAEKRQAELEEENENLRKGNNNGSGDDEDLDEKDSEPLTRGELKKMLAEKDEEARKSEDFEKSIIEDVDKLISNNEEAKDNRDNMVALMKKHPSISAYAALAMIKGMQGTDDNISPSNANKTATSKRSRSDLRKGAKAPKDMSDDELDKAVDEGLKSGDILF